MSAVPQPASGTPSAAGAPAPAPVTRIARRQAKPGREREYEATIREMVGAMRKHKGFLGADLLPPESEGGDYQVVVNFGSEAELAAWDDSTERSDFHVRLREVAANEPEYRRLSGLEAWFAPAVVPASMHPPRAKMAFVTWLGIFPTVSFYLWLVSLWPGFVEQPFLPRTAVFTGLIVITMTWLVMPRLTRLMRGFLASSKKG